VWVNYPGFAAETHAGALGMGKELTQQLVDATAAGIITKAEVSLLYPVQYTS